MQDPVLISCKSMKPEYESFKKITITCDFTIGRGLHNSVAIPFLSISRNHCKFKKTNKDEWFIEDYSTFGITVNGDRIGKGETRKLSHGDTISLEPSQEFIYEFVDPSEDSFEIPKKRIKLEENTTTACETIPKESKTYKFEESQSHEMFIDPSEDSFQIPKKRIKQEADTTTDCETIPKESIINKFEESQSHEIKHIENKILNAKQMQNTSKILKQKLQLDMGRKMKQLESFFATQIENLKGEKNEVEQQKVQLLEERDAQLATIKQDMEGKIAELMEQIQKHNKTESELLNENNLLKEKLMKDREEFLAELSRESSSKQDLLDKLESRIKEQEEIRLKEKQELEEMLRKETEQLKLAKEMELKELEEQKKLREQELIKELDDMKKNLEEQAQQTEQQRVKAEQQLNEQMEQLKKLSDEEKAKMELVIQEREEIQKKLTEAQINAEKSLEEQRERVRQRETELATLAADRIQKQAEQSGEVISSLQQQLENVRNQLRSVETEKNTLLESLCLSGSVEEGTSKQTTLAEVGELMESELQCSICAELFVAATTLNCSHTFCKYCITMWKKKKKDCPICRSSITSECKSLVLDSFIEKMVQNLTEEMKVKRKELLKFREELESELARQHSAETSRRSRSFNETDSYNSESDVVEEEESDEQDYHEQLYDELDYDEQDYFGYDEDDYRPWHRGRRYVHYTDSGSDGDSDASGSGSGSGSGSTDDAGTNTGSGSAAATSGSGTSAGSSSASVSGSGTASGADSNTGAAAGVPNNTAQRSNTTGTRRRRRGNVPGLPGAYYGGYGRCFSCGARGHWAPGCPNR